VDDGDRPETGEKLFCVHDVGPPFVDKDAASTLTGLIKWLASSSIKKHFV
jgi:hypothetical protein